MSSLLGQIKEALVVFAGLKTPPALIGGLALASHGVVRATRDVDFLVDADDADLLATDCTTSCSDWAIDASTAARMPPTTCVAKTASMCCMPTGLRPEGC